MHGVAMKKEQPYGSVGGYPPGRWMTEAFGLCSFCNRDAVAVVRGLRDDCCICHSCSTDSNVRHREMEGYKSAFVSGQGKGGIE